MDVQQRRIKEREEKLTESTGRQYLREGEGR
jgi:hypothetical protein